MAQTAEIKITADTSQADRALGNLQSSLKTLASISIGSKLTQEIFELASEVSSLNQKLRAVSDDTASANAAFGTLSGVALRTGQSLAGTVDLFQKLRNSSVFVGSSTEALSAVVEKFNQTLVLSGASSEGARSALYNFSQAMQNGSLMGNDYRAMLENNGVFLKVLQKQLGVTSTELKMMSQEGRLSAEVVAQALLNADEVAGNFAKTGVTLGQAMENFKTKSLEAMQQFDELTNITGLLANAIEFLGNNITGILIAALGALAIIFSGTIAAMSPFIAIGAAIAATVVAVGVAIQKLIDYIVAAKSVWEGFVAAMDAGAKRIADALGINYKLSENTVKINEQMAVSQEKVNKSAKEGLVITHQRNEAALQLDKSLKAHLASENAISAVMMKSTGLVSIQFEVEKAIAQERAKYVNTGEALTKQQEKEIAAATRSKILATEHASIKHEIVNLEAQMALASIGNSDELRIQTELNKLQLQYTTETYNKHRDDLELMLRATQQFETQAKLQDLFRTKPTQSEISTVGASAIQQYTVRGASVDFKKELAIMGELRDLKLIKEQEYQDARKIIMEKGFEAELAINQKIADARLKLAGVTNQAIIDSVKAQQANVQMIQQGGVAGFQGMLGALDNVMGSMSAQNKKAFEAHKALATSQAIISTYQAAAEAIAFPPGPPISLLYVAGAIAAGMAQVAAIQSQTYSGKALGGSVSGNTPYIVGEKGPEMFVPAGSGTIVPNSELKGGSPVNINFTIQANDAAGFDDLLAQRRGMITQFIKDAMTEQGQRSRM